MDRVIIVSGDGHAGAEPEVYRQYIDPQFRSAIDDLARENEGFVAMSTIQKETLSPETLDLVDNGDAIRSGGEYGSWDVNIRLRELDREGIAAELVLSGVQVAIQPFFAAINQPYPPELRAAGVQAYHRWLADCMREANGRLLGVAEAGPCLDMKQTVRDLTWLSENGYVSVTVPGNTGDAALPPLYDDYYEPFWAACDDLGLVLNVHAGWGQHQGRFWEFFEKQVAQMLSSTDVRGSMTRALATAEDSPLHGDMAPRRVLWQLMLGGVFDRHPSLKLMLTEIRADWVPATLAHLDERFEREGAPLRMRPSEYWQRNCWTTPSSVHRCEIELRHEIGINQMIFGVDFPHPESTWPNTLDWIRATFTGVPEREARLILGENAITCYGLDRGRLAAIADQIGPLPEDILGEHSVDDRLIENFHSRAGMLRPAEEVDRGELDRLIDEDLQALAVGHRENGS